MSLIELMGDEETELEATIKSLEETKLGDNVCLIIKGCRQEQGL